MVVTIRPYARRIDADTIGLYTEDLTKLLQLDKATADVITVAGGNVTGDDLLLKANPVDGTGIRIYGGNKILINATTMEFISTITMSGGRGIYTSTNNDLPLLPNGTGLVKFGTHSALAGETLSGYITIKDSGGTSRKLAVIS